MIDHAESKLVAVSQKQGYLFYNKYICFTLIIIIELIEKRGQIFEVDHEECLAPYSICFRMLLDVQRYK
jgi:hypothetical protein